ncbi:MAG: heme ABC exporter ATP-binding protein CcmA [Neomegalonema sp.]|nr:heme ABC exporter ATP-binding protein CcmA [Neomegalonema sp.]
MRLEVKDLAAFRGDRRIFAGVSFVIEPGVAATLRGPNGSGKTTLLRALAGLSRPAAGDAVAADASLQQERDLYQERIAYAGHADAVKPAMTPREALRFWGDYFDTPRAELDERVEAALTQFELTDFADRPAGRLSAGQRRRTGLARLLLLERPIWLLDEPFNALDANAVDALARIIQSHLNAGGAALLALHGPSPLREDATFNMTDFTAVAPPASDPFLDGFDDVFAQTEPLP